MTVTQHHMPNSCSPMPLHPPLADDIHFLETAERENQRETSDEVGD